MADAADEIGVLGGVDGVDHRPPQDLVEGEQRPPFLLQPDRVGRAQYAALGQRVAQREAGDVVFPSFVVEGDQRAGGIAAGVSQGASR